MEHVTIIHEGFARATSVNTYTLTVIDVGYKKKRSAGDAFTEYVQQTIADYLGLDPITVYVFSVVWAESEDKGVYVTIKFTVATYETVGYVLGLDDGGFILP
jgi:hypothetical protein